MGKPKLVVMSGLPGTGKSTLAEHIAAELKLPIFSVDPIESAVIKAGIAKSFETGYAAYLVAERLAEEQIKIGNSALIDAVNAEDEGKQTWIDLAKRMATPLIVIECVMKDEGSHHARIESRVRGLHGIKEVTWDDVQTRRAKYTQWKISVSTLEMGDGAEDNLRKALEIITRYL